jgi:hypothetical protein
LRYDLLDLVASVYCGYALCVVLRFSVDAGRLHSHPHPHSRRWLSESTKRLGIWLAEPQRLLSAETAYLLWLLSKRSDTLLWCAK